MSWSACITAAGQSVMAQNRRSLSDGAHPKLVRERLRHSRISVTTDTSAPCAPPSSPFQALSKRDRAIGTCLPHGRGGAHQFGLGAGQEIGEQTRLGRTFGRMAVRMVGRWTSVR